MKNPSGRSAFAKAMDKVGGVSRYDSAEHVDSAPEMNRRKNASQGPAQKGPFTPEPQEKKAPKKKATRGARY